MQFRDIIGRYQHSPNRFMKYLALFVSLAVAPALVAQQPKSKTQSTVRKPVAKATANKIPAKKVATAKPKPKATPKAPVLSEKERFDQASAHELAVDRVAALEKFLADFPNSENRPAALDLLTGSRALMAEEKLLTGETADAVTIFRTVIEQAPQPIPNDLFGESIANIPRSLFARGQRQAALDLATMIENKVENNAAQLLELANFYLGIEDGSSAMRIAAKAAAKDPSSGAVHRTLALAHRINFDLDLSADSYAKALELEPDSFASKLGLAEMKRALGRSSEAAALYAELRKKNEKSAAAVTGHVLALFDAGKQSEAEAELASVLAQSPGNVVLLAGAAYWYASKGMGEKAIELARKAIEREPRYIWSHIALARGLMSRGKPVEAEQALVKARAYGNFPTLEYEIACARIAGGFFREAAEDLQRQFTVTPDGMVRTKLGARIPREEKSLADLVAFERRASIFTPVAADTSENAEALRTLLVLDQKLQATERKEEEIAAAADAFAAGSDRMRLHRQLYAAALLLEKRTAIAKVLELAKAATGRTDEALEVADPRAAVMASELYEARAAAFRRNEYLAIPDVAKQTLSAILRGRVEEIMGWALYQQSNYPDAVVRLRRAVSVLPDKSAWWRSGMWRLGAALAAEGKDADALNAYIESYKTDKPDFAKYAVVEALYKKVNGSVDGLEARIGPERVMAGGGATDIATLPTPSPAPVEVASPSDPTRNSPSSEPVRSTAYPELPAVSPTKTETAEVSRTETLKMEKTPLVVPKPEASGANAPAETPKPETPRTDAPATAGHEPAQTKTEKPSDRPSARPTEVATEPETRAAETVIEKPKTAEPKDASVEKSAQPAADRSEPKASPAQPERPAKSVAKPLFEPIIITVPRPTRSEKQSDRSRARVTDETKTEDIPPCTITVSQENVSLINGGGTVGILVGLEGPGDIKTMTATSSSPRDISVILEPEIVGVSDRRFYVLKSLTSALGVYQITFAAPCGKKDVVVTVR
jgi:tetratricopeptide (TPR) repeat protein